MAILSIQTSQAGEVGVVPSYASIQTTDPEATVLTAGYLNQAVANGASFLMPCIAKVSTQETPGGAVKVGWYQVTHVGANWSLEAAGSPGDVVLPTIANHIAVYTNTTGTLSDDAATAINGGNIQAGLSGTAGYLASFPSTAAKGSLRVAAVDNAGDTSVTVSNASHGQASVYSIPDSGNAVGRFMVGATATPFVSGNFPVASGTGGLMVDSGKSAAALPTFTSPTIANHLAVFTNTTGNLGEDAATAINGGNIQAGLSGTAGSFISYPATAGNGTLRLVAANSSGAYDSTITNVGTMTQSTVYTIPNPVNAAARFLIGATNTPFVSGNFPVASGNAGLMIDSGITATNVMQTNVSNQMTSSGLLSLYKADGTEAGNLVTASGQAGTITTSALTTAGGASYTITWTNIMMNTTSSVVLTLAGGTNTVKNITLQVTQGSGSATLVIYNNTAATPLNGTLLINYIVL